jgi:hypothetical protein
VCFILTVSLLIRLMALLLLPWDVTVRLRVFVIARCFRCKAGNRISEVGDDEDDDYDNDIHDNDEYDHGAGMATTMTMIAGRDWMGWGEMRASWSLDVA